MAQKKPTLTISQAGNIPESSAIPLAPRSRLVNDRSGNVVTYSWGADATGAGLAIADATLAATP